MLLSRQTRVGVMLMIVQVLPAAASAQPFSSAAQPSSSAPAPPPAFNTVRTPTSPAFTLLGLSPSSVERPNTPADIAFALLSRATVSGTVPENFAVDTSPYWLFAHPNLDISTEYERGVLESFIRTATISVGTGQIGTSDSPVTGLSVGGRTSLLSGRLTQKTRDELKALQALLTRQSQELLALISEKLLDLSRKRISGEISPETYLRETQRLLGIAANSNAFQESPATKDLKARMQKFAVNREGFFLEIASAAGWSYPKAVWANHAFDKWGAWVTPSYQTASYSFTGVLRFISKDPENAKGAYDTGGRLTWSTDRYAFSFEAVVRKLRDSELDSRKRFAGIAEFEVRTGTWLVMSFGRDQNTPAEGSVLAQLGLSFNVSKDRAKLE